MAASVMANEKLAAKEISKIAQLSVEIMMASALKKSKKIASI
jgi:hypothetical protein